MDQTQTLSFAKQWIEDMLTFFELNLEVEVDIHDDILTVIVPSNEANSILIGRNAETLKSLQFLLSTTLRNNNASVQRVNLDIAEYKKQHAEKVAEQARQWIEEVRAGGDSKVLSLNPADRFVVHQVASEYDDIHTHSEGQGRDRRLIISQATS